MPTANKLEKKDINKQVKMYRFVVSQPWIPSLECLYQDGVYYKACPLERRILFGMSQYVIFNRRFEF